MQFLEHFHKLCELLFQFILLQALRVQNLDSGFSHGWSIFSLSFFFHKLFLLGLFPFHLVILTGLDYFLSFYLFYHWWLPSTANSLLLLNVTALTSSLPSRLGFTSELLGNDPCYLSVNNVPIWPICTSRFLSWAP